MILGSFSISLRATVLERVVHQFLVHYVVIPEKAPAVVLSSFVFQTQYSLLCLD
jgi:hypothetical protein